MGASSMSEENFQWQLPSTFNFATDVVDKWATDPTRLALIAIDDKGEETRLTYAEVASQAAKLSSLLKRRGLKQGDRVIVMLPRILEWQIVMVAVLRLGAVPIPCITMLTPADLAYRAKHAGASGVVTTSSEVQKFKSIEGLQVRVCVGSPVSGWSNFAEAKVESEDSEPARVAIDDPAILYYTSGSTGSPKGVTHAARALWAWSNSAIYWLNLKAQDRIWCTADTGWSKAGTSILFGPWSQGCSVLFYDGPFEPSKRFELLDEYQVTCFCAAATELRQLILEDVSSYDLSHLKSTVSAGESVNPEIIEKWLAMTGTTVLDGYGQTETLMTVTNRPNKEIKPGSMGLPLPGIEIGTRNADGQIGARQSAGELVIKLPNPQVMLEYRDDADRTASTQFVVDGQTWYATGDNVDIDEEGYVFYTGRADDIINSSGYRIGPQEVENALTEHAAVQECAVAGVPDADRGEVVKAWVVLMRGSIPGDDLVAELQAHVKATTAPYKYPRQIEFIDELPKTVTGKIRRNILRKQK